MYTTSATAVKLIATGILFLPFAVSSRNANTSTAASSARMTEDFHVGGEFSRRSRASVRFWRLRASGVGGRPVRPRVSIVPAGVPRCFVRRLRLVWAIVRQELSLLIGPPEGVFDRRATA